MTPEANTSLIAAARDLLAAAHRLLKYAGNIHGSYLVHESEIQTLRGAVAKADVLIASTDREER